MGDATLNRRLADMGGAPGTLRGRCQVLALGVAAAFTALAGFAGSAAAQQGPLPVDVATPLSARIVDWDEYTGRFEAAERVELRARVSGYLDAVEFRDGQIVEEGDILFRIDPRTFDAALARAQAELAAAEAEQTRADTDLLRGEQLVATQAVSESTLDIRRAEKLRADAEVAMAEAALTQAQLDLDFTVIRAPFSGRISDTAVDPGNLVTGGQTVLATIVSTDPIHLVFTASEADFLKYARLSASGSRPSSRAAPNVVQARLIDESGWPHEGRMDFVANELDPNAGTITGRAIFENPDDFLTPGLFARLRLIASGEYDALLVPDSAILSDQARKVVMTVNAENVVEPRVVTPGALYRGLRVIEAGLEAGDRVVVAGVMRARPGAPVTPEETAIEFLAPETGAASVSN